LITKDCGLAKNSKRSAAVADSALIALSEEYIAVEQQYCDFQLAVDRMQGKILGLPDALRIRPEDAELARKAHVSTDEYWHRPCDIGQWRRLETWEQVSKIDTADRLEIALRKTEPSKELRTRAEEIVSAYDNWTATRKRPRGYRKAVREMNRAERAYMRLEAQICETPATTLEGMRAKVRCAQAYMKEEDIDRIDGGSAAESMAVSIFKDILRMTGTRA
jgi:hypothetical protein